MIILFDGVCNMCVGSVNFIIKRDSKDMFRFDQLLGDAYLQGGAQVAPAWNFRPRV